LPTVARCSYRVSQKSIILMFAADSEGWTDIAGHWQGSSESIRLQRMWTMT
jgi:hypothetical protein